MPVPWRRWLATFTVAGLVSAGCVTAGIWQWNRHVQRSAEVAVVLEHAAADPVPLDQVVRAPDAALPDDQAWRRVSVTGSYLEPQVLLRNRPVGGIAGFHVLAGLLVADGRLAGQVLVVDRGWVPLGPDGSGPASVPRPPLGPVEVVVLLRADERPSARDAPAGQVQALNADQVAEAAGGPWSAAQTLAVTGAAETEGGARPAGLGALAGPSTDLGSHLSYAFQWWVFAAGALVGAVLLLRRDAIQDATAGAEAGEGDGAPPGRRVRPARRPTAEQEEDAWVDADPQP